MLFEFLWFMLIIICICILIPGPGSCGCISLFGGRETRKQFLAPVVLYFFFAGLPTYNMGSLIYLGLCRLQPFFFLSLPVQCL